MIQIRNVPDDVHKRLKEKAASQGQSLSDYLNNVLSRDAKFKTWAEVAETLRKLPPVHLKEPAADLIRRQRDERAAYLSELGWRK